MTKVSDHFWLWGHEAGSHSNYRQLSGRHSRMTPAEGAFYLGVPNLIMVRYGGKPQPPLDPYARSFLPLKQVVWSIVGAGGWTDQGYSELDEVLSLAQRYPNVTGAIMDDFFRNPATSDKAAAFTPHRLAQIRKRLHAAAKLDLWVVLYDYQLGWDVRPHLAHCDTITYWTWKAPDLLNLERHFERLEKLNNGAARLVLGCYLFDYGTSRMMPVRQMRQQCEIGLRLLREKRIGGMIFLASCICDMNLKAVEWTRSWIREVGMDKL